MKGVIDAGLIEARPGESDPVAMNLLTKLSTSAQGRRQRQRSPSPPRSRQGTRRPRLLLQKVQPIVAVGAAAVLLGVFLVSFLPSRRWRAGTSRMGLVPASHPN